MSSEASFGTAASRRDVIAIELLSKNELCVFRQLGVRALPGLPQTEAIVQVDFACGRIGVLGLDLQFRAAPALPHAWAAVRRQVATE